MDKVLTKERAGNKLKKRSIESAMRNSLRTSLLNSSDPCFVRAASKSYLYGSIAPSRLSSTGYLQSNRQSIDELKEETRISVIDNGSQVSLLSSQKNRFTSLPLVIQLQILHFGAYNDAVLFPFYDYKKEEFRLYIIKISNLKQAQFLPSLDSSVLFYCQSLIDYKLSLLAEVKQQDIAFTEFKTSHSNTEQASLLRARRNKIRHWLSQGDNNHCYLFFKYYCDNVSLLVLSATSCYLFLGTYTYFKQCMADDWRYQCVTQKLPTQLCTLPCNETVIYRMGRANHFTKNKKMNFYRGCVGGEQKVQPVSACCFLINFLENTGYFFSGAFILVFASMLISSYCKKTCFKTLSKRMRDNIEIQESSLEGIRSFLETRGQRRLNASEKVGNALEGEEKKEESKQMLTHF